MKQDRLIQGLKKPHHGLCLDRAVATSLLAAICGISYESIIILNPGKKDQHCIISYVFSLQCGRNEFVGMGWESDVTMHGKPEASPRLAAVHLTSVSISR